MQKKLFMVAVLMVTGFLVGCAADNLNAPCPHFGKGCHKTSVNSWNDRVYR